MFYGADTVRKYWQTAVTNQSEILVLVWKTRTKAEDKENTQ
jgi:hypothetical protein